MTLREVLRPERLTQVVDIGANPIDGDPPYKAMLAAGLCRLTGFEPQPEALAALQRRQGPLERYLPYAVGDGREGTLRVCRGAGMTSLLEPDPAVLEMFAALAPLGAVVQTVPIATRRLDDIDEIGELDFLKMDVQGSEMAVLESGVRKLQTAVVVQLEVSFISLYRNQPGFGAVDVEMRRQGFVPHCFAAVKRWPIAPCVVNNDPRRPLNQLLEADLVYTRDFTRADGLCTEQLKHLALLAHHCYASFDLALRCVMFLERRGHVAAGAQRRYVESMTPLAR